MRSSGTVAINHQAGFFFFFFSLLSSRGCSFATRFDAACSEESVSSRTPARRGGRIGRG